jgi:carbamoyl-phosphate synthase small subunit
MLACALGAETYKLKFGHHGINHPVLNLASGEVEITSQNHGFAVEQQSLERVGGLTTHLNLNDRSLEGFSHREHPLFAVQYHPEAAPGPHDSRYLFDLFLRLIETGTVPAQLLPRGR